jgi:hypothetical protein
MEPLNSVEIKKAIADTNRTLRNAKRKKVQDPEWIETLESDLVSWYMALYLQEAIESGAIVPVKK